MCKTFTVTIPPEEDNFFENTRAAVEAMGATLDGDEKAGTFSGRGVEGSYAVEGDRVTVTITKKPALAPWPIIETIVKDFFC
jgi:hypothetical protein